jgi:8-oxo-dGTP pyrophosphatase MutT (NUDIX family)
MSELTHAGGIVIRSVNGELQYLIITAKENPDHWVFPKGHIDLGETPEQTAKREVLEETGVEAEIIEFVGTNVFEAKGEAVRVKFFLMKYIGEKGNPENREKRWCTFEEGFKLLTFKDTQNLLQLSQPLAEKSIKKGVDMGSSQERLAESAKELLLADYKYLGESFWKNEETGETRVKFFITLVTAVLAALAALAKSKDGLVTNDVLALVSIYALFALMVLGTVTLFRMMQRNATTDGFKQYMDDIRHRFKGDLDQVPLLEGYKPFRHSPPIRKLGGLAHTVAALNSLLAAALAGIIIALLEANEAIFGAKEAIFGATEIDIGLGALIIFGISLGGQIFLIGKVEASAKNERENNPDISPFGNSC